MTILAKCDKCRKIIDLRKEKIYNMKDLRKLGWTTSKGQVHICDECNQFIKQISFEKEKGIDDLLTHDINQPQIIKNKIDHSGEIPIDVDFRTEEIDTRDVSGLKTDQGKIIRYRIYECRYCDFSKGACPCYKKHEYSCIVGVNINVEGDRSKAIYKLLKHEKEHSEFEPVPRGKQRKTKWRTKKV